jgi:uncharacterized membrane protein
MENLVFILWVLLWPVSTALCLYIKHASGRDYSDNTHAVSALISIIVWVWIGNLLYVN